MRLKSSIRLILICWVVCFISCNTINRDPVILPAQKTSDHMHLVDQYNLIRPVGFMEGQSYYGFQDGYKAGVRFNIKDISFSDQKKSFSENQTKVRRIDLFRFSPASYLQNDSCYYAEYYSKSQNVMKYELGVEHNNQMIIVQGYCTEDGKSIYGDRLKKTVQSLYIGDFKALEYEYQIASFDESGKMIYTKDGKYPTEAIGSPYFKVSFLDKKENAYLRSDIRKIVEDVVLEQTGEDSDVFGVEKPKGANMYYAKAKGNGKKVMAKVIFLEEETILLELGCKESYDIRSIMDFVNDKMLSSARVIGGQ